jgi:hypothetical protein
MLENIFRLGCEQAGPARSAGEERFVWSAVLQGCGGLAAAEGRTEAAGAIAGRVGVEWLVLVLEEVLGPVVAGPAAGGGGRGRGGRRGGRRRRPRLDQETREE